MSRTCNWCGEPLPEGADGRARTHEGECRDEWRKQRHTLTPEARSAQRARQARAILRNQDAYTASQVRWARVTAGEPIIEGAP
jgi:hypothetical protein